MQVRISLVSELLVKVRRQARNRKTMYILSSSW
jgi:hypothetical protein